MRVIVGISGASGAILGERLVRHLLASGAEAHVILSDSGIKVFEEEIGVRLGKDFKTVRANFLKHYRGDKKLFVSPADDFADRLSSGSSKMDAMVICPCSLSTAAAIANGITMNLIHRAASVSIKEKRPLLLVPRESPLSPIHLKNLLYLSEIGVHIVPATTAFYHKPKTVEEMVDFTLGRVMDLLKIEHKLFKRWRENGNED
jgi:4-hydroxy-3-polyprenylbenzoate decarboxylase